MASPLDAAAPALRAPFPPGAEQYRTGPTWEQDGARWTRPLGYIDARAVFDRLDAAAGPGGWSTRLERLGPGVYLCHLTVHGVTRCDVGQAGENEGEKEKSGASDALKRAAVQFGVGAYLYNQELPPVRLERRGSDWALPRGWRPAGRAQPGPSAPSSGPARVAPAVLEADRAPAPSGGATARQLGKIGAELARVGWDEERERAHLQAAFGRDERRALTAAEASRLIDTLVARPALSS